VQSQASNAPLLVLISCYRTLSHEDEQTQAPALWAMVLHKTCVLLSWQSQSHVEMAAALAHGPSFAKSPDQVPQVHSVGIDQCSAWDASKHRAFSPVHNCSAGVAAAGRRLKHAVC
jgi:hypothetical protein